MMKRMVYTASVGMLVLTGNVADASGCEENEDCAEGQICYRAGTAQSSCIEGGMLGSSSSDDDDYDPVQELLDMLFDGDEMSFDDTPECENVRTAAMNTLDNDMQDEQCEPMWNALNVTHGIPDDDDENPNGDFDPARLDGYLLWEMINNEAELNDVCGSPCFPLLWATSTRAAAVCYDQTFPESLNYVCSENQDNHYCLEYSDEIASIFEELATSATGTDQSSILDALRSHCSTFEEMKCCFGSFVDLYETFRARLHEVVQNLPEDVRNSEYGENLVELDNVLELISGHNLRSLTGLACFENFNEDKYDACPVPADIQAAIDAVAEEYPYPSSDDNPNDDDNSKSSTSAAGGAAVAAIVIVLVLVAIFAGVAFWWMRRRANRFDGASNSGRKRSVLDGEVVDIDSGDNGNYVPVVMSDLNNDAM